MASIKFDWTAKQFKEVRENIDGADHAQNRSPKDKSDTDVVRDFMLDQVNQFLLNQDIQKAQIDAGATARENRKQKRLN